MHTHPPNGLDLLEARLRQDLSWLELPAKPWMIKKSHEGQSVIEVAIIGAGMAGLTAGTALSLLGLHPVLFDRAPEGYEGPWVTTARMETLRSPKQLTGPALGLPALTFRAWFEAQFGAQAWIELDKIPRTQWMEYLRWYRKVTHLEIRNEHQVLEVLPERINLSSFRYKPQKAWKRFLLDVLSLPRAETAWVAPHSLISRARSPNSAEHTPLMRLTINHLKENA